MAFRHLLATVGLCAAFLLSGRSAYADILDYNLVVAGNLQSSSQVQGSTVVGGNLSGGASNYATGLTPPADYSDVTTLVVGDTLLSTNLNISAGDVRLAGSQGSTSINFNGPGGELFENDPTTLSIANQAIADMQAASTAFSGLTANSTVNQTGSTFTFEATPGSEGIAVFEIDIANLVDPNALFELSLAAAPAGTTVVINAIGQLTAPLTGNFGAGFTDPSISTKVIWNFADVTSGTLDREWWGSVLVPNATLLTNNAAINGSLYVGGSLNQNGEVRLPGFSGIVPAPVPEPSSMILLSLIGVGAVGVRRFRRRDRAEAAA